MCGLIPVFVPWLQFVVLWFSILSASPRLRVRHFRMVSFGPLGGHRSSTYLLAHWLASV